MVIFCSVLCVYIYEYIILRNTVIDTHVFDWTFMFSSTVVASVMGLRVRCAGQLHSL